MFTKQYFINRKINILDFEDALFLLEDLGINRERKIKSLIKQQDYLKKTKEIIDALVNLEKDYKQKRLLLKLKNDFEFIESNYKLEPKITIK